MDAALDSEGAQHLEIDVPTAVQKQALNARQWFPVKKKQIKTNTSSSSGSGTQMHFGLWRFSRPIMV